MPAVGDRCVFWVFEPGGSEDSMPEQMIDLRSDTVTKPSAGMRKAMADAKVGDDVLGDDPTTNRLEGELASRLGKEAAIFMPSGTMTNQVAIRLHCGPGDEFLCEQNCHIYNHEQGAFAQLSGVVAQPIPTEQGMLELANVLPRVRSENDHLVRTRMVCLENTHNRHGGRILPFDKVQELSAGVREMGLRIHLDGARLFNAVVASGIDAARWAAEFDTVSVCFSKGLGAPVGSALAGDRDRIRTARRHRKVFGGGMRQSGVIAAAALFALDNHVDRLSQDHENARQLAGYIQAADGLTLSYRDVETNILFFEVDPQLGTASEVVKELADQGVAVLAESLQTVRALTHLDVTREQIDEAGTIIQRVVEQRLRSVG